METHPIPQNVTSFQFKLVGEMTLKQFMYLAIGVSIAYVNFIFLASRLPYLAWPIIILSATSGAAFAFLPIADRPLDYWLGAFLKAIYSPTKGIWIKNGQTYKENPVFAKRISILDPLAKAVPQGQPSNQITPVSPQIKAALSQIQAQPTPQETPNVTVLPANLPTTAELEKTVELAKQAQSIQAQIIDTQRQLTQIKDNSLQANNDQASDQINQVLGNLQMLVNEASAIKQKLDTLTHTSAQPKTKVKVSTVIPVTPKPTQIILTTYPNVINGFIKDAVGNYLDSVVVVIYDKQGLPVRALKTNKLGQFSGATPLPNGVYTIQLEKDNLVFDVLQIELAGEVLPALIIAAKKMV